jgi:YidC/Oxa1 family membrane protein insertase
MIKEFFSTTVYEPLYNLLAFSVGIMPGYSVFLAVIFVTVLVKAALLPFAHKSAKTQKSLRKIEPEIKKLKDKHKDNKEAQSLAVMNLYKEHGVNPFSGCLWAFIQIPVIFGLYFVFWKGLSIGVFDPKLLYSFVPNPEVINFSVWSLFDLREKSVVLAALAAISQYFQMSLAMPPVADVDGEKSFSNEFKKSLNTQMRYVLPFIIGFVSYGFPAVVPLYWVTSNIFSIIHELWVRKESKELLVQT